MDSPTSSHGQNMNHSSSEKEEPVMNNGWTVSTPGNFEMILTSDYPGEDNEVSADTSDCEANGEDNDRIPSKAQSSTETVEVEEENTTHEGLTLAQHLFSSWYIVLTILLPIILLPLNFCFSEKYKSQGRCAYVIILMAVFWTTEALPLSVTSLLPVVLLPALGVMRARDVSALYFNDTSMLFVGGLVVAIAVEVWDVHRRIALLVLKVVGAEPKRLLLGIVLVTWFLSMWISNTATAAMMMTIVSALLSQFKQVGDQAIQVKYSAPSNDSEGVDGHLGEDESSKIKADQAEADAKHERLTKAISLAVAYSANIGGIASLTGTGPNLVFFAAANELFREYGMTSPVNFATWLVYCLPLAFIAVLLMWGWLIFYYLRCRGCCVLCGCGDVSDPEAIKRVQSTLSQEYVNLGPVTYAQGSVLCCFVALVVGWITRNLGGGAGWGEWFPNGFVSDSTPSTLAAIMLFVLPSSLPEVFKRRVNTHASYSRIEPLMSWKHIHEKMPWSLYLLLGGGFAIAAASQESGLSAWVGERLLVLQNLNHWAILLIICYITIFATEITSNTAIATLLMPILSQMALSLRVNPLFFMYPAAIATSFAFMLPVATPPNAIIFSHGTVKVIDMVKTGIFLNLVCVPLLLFATATWGNAFFHFDSNPSGFLKNISESVYDS
ncbi:solute carrier family 13 member 2-like [Plakobranchus ocellatus]|uniref:Solute carrier family 13 member 2-like n=1 Tax=Plakobranchus ocellatus TaxID=259542 RepID=A0AAV4AQQ5_9GAST|nr:solute carrier family 13 member 2-like [Plakobranchus ocellatus]